MTCGKTEIVADKSTADGTIKFRPTVNGKAGAVVEGDYVITVTNTVDVKGGKPVTSVGTYEFTVTVGDPALDRIEVTVPYSVESTNYHVSDVVDLSGLIVTAYDEKGESEVLSASDYTVAIEGETGMQLTSYADKKSVTVTYGEETATFEINMQARTASVTAADDTFTLAIRCV